MSRAPEVPRDYARRVADQGMMLILHAANLCDDRPGYRYADRERLKELLGHLMDFFENSQIEIDRPRESDPQFAAFLSSTIAGASAVGDDHG